MDKNIAAILRQDARTIGVRFTDERTGELGAKVYTYVTDIEFQIGDKAIVEAREQLKVVEVCRVDTDLEIEPNSDTTYKWIVGKVNTDRYFANLEKNREIERTLAVAYRNSMRQSYAAQILAGVDEDQRSRLGDLLGGQNNG